MPVVSLFATASEADAAVNDLKRIGFHDRAISVIRKGGEQVTAHHLASAGVEGAEAEAYAARINAGATLVAVDPPFGWALRATKVLRRNHSTTTETTAADATPAVHDTSSLAWSDATPLSSALGWRVLSHDPAPLSSFLHFPTLSSKQRSDTRLSHKAAPLSSMLGLPTLSHNASPFSSMLGLKTLADNPAPLSSALGLRTLSRNPAPLSSTVGMKVLTENPAPLSSALHAPTLSDEAAPLSSAAHAPTLTEEHPPKT